MNRILIFPCSLKRKLYLLFCFSDLFLSRDARKTTNGNVAQLKVFCDQILAKSCNFYPQEMLHYERGWFFWDIINPNHANQMIRPPVDANCYLAEILFYVDNKHLIRTATLQLLRAPGLGQSQICPDITTCVMWPAVAATMAGRARKLAIRHQ